MAEGGVVCAQVVLSIFNIIQFICGWLLIVVGAIIKVKGPKEHGGQDETVIFLIFIGCIQVVVSLVGCFGAWTKNMCLLITFCVCTSIGFLLEVLTMALAFAGRSSTNESMEAGMKELIKWNDTTAFDALQTHSQCCGVNSYTDWELNPRFKGTGYLPDSCCKSKEIGCYPDSSSINQQGCLAFVGAAVKYVFTVAGAASAVAAVVLFLAVLAAAYMAHRIKSSYHPV